MIIIVILYIKGHSTNGGAHSLVHIYHLVYLVVQWHGQSDQCDKFLHCSVVTTPFNAGVSTAITPNMSVNTSMQARSKFNLHSSLQKKITWQAHAGSLKPFTQGNLYTHQANVKQVKVATK